MQVTQERPEDNALTMEKCSATLGLAEFSLFSRVQTGDIKAVRARSGEMLIPNSEVDRLVNGFANKPSDHDGTILPDSMLGIRAKYGGRAGTQLFYRVQGLDLPLTENTISGLSRCIQRDFWAMPIRQVLEPAIARRRPIA